MQIRKVLVTLFVMITTLLTSAIAFAETAEAVGAGGEGIGPTGAKYLAAAFGIAIAAAAGAIAQSKAASTALEGIARNPNATSKLFTPMILALALIESLVIYALIISLLLVLI